MSSSSYYFNSYSSYYNSKARDYSGEEEANYVYPDATNLTTGFNPYFDPVVVNVTTTVTATDHRSFDYPIVTFDYDDPDRTNYRIAHVGTDQEILGRTLARLLRQQRPEGGTFGLVGRKEGLTEGFFFTRNHAR